MREPLIEVSVPAPSREVEQRARDALVQAEATQIANADDYQQASEQLRALKAKWRQVDETRKQLRQPLDLALKRLQAFFAGPLDFLEQAEAILKRKLVAYADEQGRLRREEQTRANAEAERQRARLLAKAARADAAGKTDAALVLEDQATATVAPIIEADMPKICGQSLRETWCFEIKEASALPREYLTADLPRIRRVVQALKGDARIAGVRVWSERRLASGS